MREESEKFWSVADAAMAMATGRYPLADVRLHAAFANAVAYLVTGVAGGYGGPSLREHLVTWACLGLNRGTWREDLLVSQGNAPVGCLPVFYLPENCHSLPGEWQFSEACKFAEVYVFNPIPPPILRRISSVEHHYDDTDEDLEAIRD